MRLRTLHLSLVVLAGGCAGARPAIQSREHLGVTRVVLFQNGLGYFERRGTTTSGGIELEVRRDHVDDVLKSLTVVDNGGGRVSSVRVLPAPPTSETVTLGLGISGGERHDLSISY